MKKLKRKAKLLWLRSLKWINQPSITSMGSQQHLPLWHSVLYDYFHWFILGPISLVTIWPYRVIKRISRLQHPKLLTF